MLRNIPRAALTIALFSALAISGTGQESPSFDGRWELNRDESDDAQSKIQEMRQKMMEGRGGDRRGMGGGGRRGGMGGGGRGGMGGGDRGGGRTGGAMGAMAQPEILDIEIVDDEFHVDDGRVVAIFYVDGEEHKRQGEDGRSIKTTATRKGNTVVVEEERDAGRMTIESTRRYELSPDGETMVLTLQFKPPRSKEPMVIRSVYELVE